MYKSKKEKDYLNVKKNINELNFSYWPNRLRNYRNKHKNIDKFEKEIEWVVKNNIEYLENNYNSFLKFYNYIQSNTNNLVNEFNNEYNTRKNILKEIQEKTCNISKYLPFFTKSKLNEINFIKSIFVKLDVNEDKLNILSENIYKTKIGIDLINKCKIYRCSSINIENIIVNEILQFNLIDKLLNSFCENKNNINKSSQTKNNSFLNSTL